MVLRIECSDTRIEQYNTEAVKNFTEDFLIHLDKLWLRMELPQKQALQSEIFPKGLVVENEKIRTVGLASTFELIAAMKDENFHFVTPSVEVRKNIIPSLIKYYSVFSNEMARMNSRPLSYSL